MKSLLLTIAAASALISMTATPIDLTGRSEGIRAPAVAGRFYPGDAAQLEAAIRGFLADATPPRGERPLVLIAPHAGYVFSGQIAADAYRQAMDHEYDLVVILGTNHTSPGFRGVSVYEGEGYRTPLGVAKIDREVARALIESDVAFSFQPGVHSREHSVEVQVPFVQTILPGVPIVTAVVGTADLDLCNRFAEALAAVVKGRKPLVVASTDLSHYPAHDDAVRVDRRTLEAVASMDLRSVQSAIRKEMSRAPSGLSTCACGEAPTLAALAAGRALGAGRADVVSYANSGDTLLGQPGRVVGYGAVALFPGEGESNLSALRDPEVAPKELPLSDSDGKALLALARATIERYLTSETVPLPRTGSPTLRRKQGAFVTLTMGGELRGCIGHMEEDLPLVTAVANVALGAAFRDHRFRPLTREELDEVEVEVSVLTPAEEVSGPDEIVIGRDGVILAKGGRRAVFLPKVAEERGWDVATTLDHLCRKGGMERGCWRKGAQFFTFQAVVFSESGKEKKPEAVS